MSERVGWTVTTHDWSKDLDTEHLAGIRSRADEFGRGGQRHLILEVLAYANDEAESLGRIGTAVVTTHEDGAVTVADDGRGTDTRVDADGSIVRKPVMATKDVRFFDAADAPVLPDGLPRRGMSTVAALSPVLVHENHRADGAWFQTYRHGVPDAELREIPTGDANGTSVRFRCDRTLPGPDSLTEGDLRGFSWLRIALRPSDPGGRRDRDTDDSGVTPPER